MVFLYEECLLECQDFFFFNLRRTLSNCSITGQVLLSDNWPENKMTWPKWEHER